MPFLRAAYTAVTPHKGVLLHDQARQADADGTDGSDKNTHTWVLMEHRDPSSLVRITNININTNLPQGDRSASFKGSLFVLVLR